MEIQNNCGCTDDKVVVYNRSLGEMVRDATQAFIPLNIYYKPEDIKNIDYERDLADPGSYPFTRGIYPQMYRKKLWIKSFILYNYRKINNYSLNLYAS